MDSNSGNFATTIIHSLTLTQSWFYIPILGDRTIINNGFGLSWSISTEWFFYACYAILVFKISHLNSKKIILSCIVIASLIPFTLDVLGVSHFKDVELFATTYLNNLSSSDQSNAFRWFFYYSPYGRVWEFVVGCLTAQLFIQFRSSPSRLEWVCARLILAASLIALATVSVLRSLSWLGSAASTYLNVLELNFTCTLPIAAVIFCVARYDTRIGRWLSAPLAIYLGELSYSLYAVHTWTLRIFERPPQPYTVSAGIETVLRIAAAIVLTMLLASSTYRWIEVPGRAFLRRFGARKLQLLFGSERARPGGEKFPMASLASLAVLLLVLAFYQFVAVQHLPTSP